MASGRLSKDVFGWDGKKFTPKEIAIFIASEFSQLGTLGHDTFLQNLCALFVVDWNFGRDGFFF